MEAERDRETDRQTDGHWRETRYADRETDTAETRHTESKAQQTQKVRDRQADGQTDRSVGVVVDVGAGVNVGAGVWCGVCGVGCVVCGGGRGKKHRYCIAIVRGHTPRL